MLTVLRTIARRVAAVIDDCRYAQRRLAQLQANPNAHMLHPGQAPDTYREFLYRTSGPLAHEPSATQRALGRAIR
ncbi:MAG TPA: hypothetical protein VGR98_16275 [Streptosporangiaceae bacterium]|jgi:hypothetical protein|nr:hypothetical protein [Streptosporangiaceae bacterium]